MVEYLVGFNNIGNNQSTLPVLRYSSVPLEFLLIRCEQMLAFYSLEAVTESCCSEITFLPTLRISVKFPFYFCLCS